MHLLGEEKITLDNHFYIFIILHAICPKNMDQCLMSKERFNPSNLGLVLFRIWTWLHPSMVQYIPFNDIKRSTLVYYNYFSILVPRDIWFGRATHVTLELHSASFLYCLISKRLVKNWCCKKGWRKNIVFLSSLVTMVDDLYVYT